jgi:hypothetical protein
LGEPPDPLKSVAQGVTAAGIEWSEQKVRDLVKQFQNRKLAFLKNADNIELVKEERKSSEYAILKQFVPETYAIQVQMGLALRRIATDQGRVIPLVDKIRRKYGRKGLHVAEITQVGITNQLLTHLVELYRDTPEVITRLTYFLDHVEDLVIFVRSFDKPNAIVTEIVNRIESLEAHMMILFGSGYAQNILDKTLKIVENEEREYVIERRREGVQTIAFIFTPELRANISHWSESIAPSEGSRS